MHKAVAISFPDLTSAAYCLCGYVGQRREGEKCESTALIDSAAHLERELKDEWARTASNEANILRCPLCKLGLRHDEDYPDYLECSNHSFLIRNTRKGTLLELEQRYGGASISVDLSWDDRCPVVNCPGLILDERYSYSNDSDMICSEGHAFDILHRDAPFLYLEIK